MAESFLVLCNILLLNSKRWVLARTVRYFYVGLLHRCSIWQHAHTSNNERTASLAKLFCNFTLPFPSFFSTIAHKQDKTTVDQGAFFYTIVQRETEKSEFSSFHKRVLPLFQTPKGIIQLIIQPTHKHRCKYATHTHKHMNRTCQGTAMTYLQAIFGTT